MNRVSKLFSVFPIVFIFIFQSALAQNETDLKNRILQAISDGANYACDVLLDENGKSRCDYNWLDGTWHDYEPPWHTGQLIYGLLEAYQVTRNSKFLAAARRAGDWWIGLEIKDHPKLKGMVRAVHGDGIDFIVFATVSDGTAGLFKLYEVTGDRKYAEVPTRAGEWMLQNMYVRDKGVFYDSIEPITGEVMKENSPFWPEKKQQQLYDVARPNNEGSLFKDMYEFTQNEKYRQVFIELCESLVEKQGEEGLWMDFMPNHKEDGSFHPRFNLWYAESLLDGYDLTGDKRYIEAAKKTAQFYTKFQKEDGTIYYQNYLNGKSNQNSPCGSAVSFAGIIWLRLIQYGVGDEFKTNVERSLKWVLNNRFAADHPDKNLAGGFFELRTRSKDGKMWLTVRDIATAFGLRFLCDCYRWLGETK
ncbi:MAG: glycoside hydrolase family 88 protein [candidate division KSB1 bacterium]|nr:glycoside hydrolase family 88 protein [candidate division KSB1 bacterium]